MAKIYMIRHGRAAAGWDMDRDPGLDDHGRAQAEAVAKEIEARVGTKLPLISSPLRRCRETALPLAGAFGADVAIEPRVAEIPSPIEDLTARTNWLREVMAGSWDDLYAHPDTQKARGTVDFAQWRQGVRDALLSLQEDTVVFSHFIAINVAAGWAEGSEEVTLFRPDNCSVTVFDTAGQRLNLVERGKEAETTVN